MNKFMRLFIFFDLPTKTKDERKEATKFRSFLKKDGYWMLQWSVYSRICNGSDAVEMHKRRLKENLPPKGAIRALTLTEKQFESMDIVLAFGDQNSRSLDKEAKKLINVL